MVVTVPVTVGVVIIVTLNEAIFWVAVEVRVLGLVVVSSIGRVVTREVADTFETMVTVV